MKLLLQATDSLILPTLPVAIIMGMPAMVYIMHKDSKLMALSDISQKKKTF